jgi:hypothetical protein
MVMEEGHHKSKFTHEVVQCTQVIGNCEATAIFGADESNMVDHGGNKGQRLSSVKCHERNSLDPRKDNFLKLMCCTVLIACTAVVSFFQNPALDCESNPHNF